MELWNLIVRFFQGGGNFMYPIAFVFVVGLAMAIERYIYLSLTAARNRGLWNEIVPLLFIHAWLQTRTTELIDSLEMASVKFLNAITERQSAPAAA